MKMMSDKQQASRIKQGFGSGSIPTKTRRYMAGMDGLRTLAVLAVIAYHLNLGWAPGGLLGVGVFFVLSGYLITDILADQWRRSGRLDLKDFWIRRARRLLPAMLFMITCVYIWMTLFQSAGLNKLHGDIRASLLYVMNWWYVYREVSYFDSFGPPSPLSNLWSLAVEEQFYLIWPLLLAIGLRYIPQRGKLIGFTLAAITASALAMAILYEPGTDPSRVYYGTDTRAFSLLIGAVLAFVWPSQKLVQQVSARARFSLDLAGVIALSVIGYMIWKTNEYDPFLYRGGMVLLSIAAAVLIAVLAHPASLLGRILGCKPFRYLGVRSYGIYLWHFPVIVLTSPTVHSGGIDVTRAIFQVALTIGLAAFSYRFIEEPIRLGVWTQLWRGWMIGERRSQFLPRRLWLNSALVMLALVITSSCATYLFPSSPASVGSTTPPSQTITPSDPGDGTGKGDAAGLPTGTLPIEPADPPSEHTTEPEPPPNPNIPTSTPPPAEHAGSSAGKGITVIGDSVILGAAPLLEKQLPGIVIDCKIGRQMSQASEIVNQLRVDSKLGHKLIIQLGTNGAFPANKLDALLRSLEDLEHILLINTRVPRPWEDEVNTTLSEVGAKYKNVTLIDWHTASRNKDSYFYEDGVHLTSEGAEQYASLLIDAMKP